MKAAAQQYSYSPSVNIIRDKGKKLRYINTYNGQRAFEQIINLAPAGARAFTLIGAYGSGKSSFLWALAETASGAAHFENYHYLLQGYKNTAFLDLVGDFSSITNSFAQSLNCEVKEVLSALIAKADGLKKKNTALVIRIDEFGKFLEFAAKTSPEREFYFLQQLAEVANDQQRNIILLTTLHQDFAAYAYHLSERQRNEWLKVKGRFKEITFNEPAEQLLILAANRMAVIDFPVETSMLEDLLETVQEANAFPLSDYFNIEVAGKLSPIEILAGSVLTLSLQRYAQNERSLFSFIESHDFRGLESFIASPDAVLYNLVHVHDYLIYHYYNQLTTKENVDYRAWRLIRENLESIEGHLDGIQLKEASQLIKIIGLLNLFGKGSINIDDKFLVGYGQIVLAQQQTTEVLRILSQKKLIRFREHSNKYVLFEGTDVDIEYAIDEAGNLIGHVANVSTLLNQYFTFPVMAAKKFQIDYGTPRYFEIIVSDEPISQVPTGERDGFINLIFSGAIGRDEVKKHSQDNQEAILYVYFNNTQRIREEITQIEKVKQARSKYNDDRNARHEFDQIIGHHQNILRYLVLDSFYTADKAYVSFYFRGAEVTKIRNRRSLNHFLSEIAETVYSSTPHFLSEMLNKSRVSTAMLSARKNLINKLIENTSEKDLGFSPKLYPPEKTIYLSLIQDKGFHREIDGIWQLSEPTDESFAPVWATFEDFLNNAKHARLSLQELVDNLLTRPLKLKRGLVDFLLPVFLLVRQSDFALFNQDGFIPKISADLLDLIVKKPSDYAIKSFSSAGINLSVFNKYRALLNQKEESRTSNSGFIETIRPFLAFYDSLPEYSQQTNKISREAIALRHSIAESTDPEKTFFEDFPNAIGYSLKELDDDQQKLETYFSALRAAISDIRSSYQNLIGRFEGFILAEIVGDKDLDFEQWKQKIQKRFKNIKGYIVPAHLKVFLQRIHSNIDDRNTWLSSLAHAVTGSQLEEFTDQQELLLFNKFKEWVHELDNFTDMQPGGEDTSLQDSVRVEITTLEKGVLKQVLRVPKSKEKEIEKVQKRMHKELTEDKNLNIFILTKMLNELIK
ncbi:hypothetical protein QWY86_05440 [Pedobacter aquatilis]|uniref:hypothetical protein n=1 Tax=Pedobacter aquatilis TaxID=351343 RepID=UPI0025B547DB|nr:hypothetical protein [Pedobacter aquatilis]MDN3586100.1 hypothetical protein [Pedobacter aquatilis]